MAASTEVNTALGRAPEAEPNWSEWYPVPATDTLSPSLPLTQLPPFRIDPNDLRPYQGPIPFAPQPPAQFPPIPPPILASPVPAGTSPIFDFSSQPSSIFDQDTPAQPVVLYPDGRTEVLALRPTEVIKGLKEGAKFVKEHGKWVVRVGSKVLGPIGVAGTIKDIYDFNQWVNENAPPEQPRFESKYDLMSNTVLYRHPGDYWLPTPPPDVFA